MAEIANTPARTPQGLAVQLRRVQAAIELTNLPAPVGPVPPQPRLSGGKHGGGGDPSKNADGNDQAPAK